MKRHLGSTSTEYLLIQVRYELRTVRGRSNIRIQILELFSPPVGKLHFLNIVAQKDCNWWGSSNLTAVRMSAPAGKRNVQTISPSAGKRNDTTIMSGRRQKAITV